MAAPKGGHISRRFIQKQAAENDELKAEMDKAREEARKELTEKREVRAESAAFPIEFGGLPLCDAVPPPKDAPAAEYPRARRHAVARAAAEPRRAGRLPAGHRDRGDGI